METRTIRITENDLKKLRDVIQEAKLGGYRSSPKIHELLGEMERAEVVKPRDIPADVITMNSEVMLTDIAAGEPLELTLVFPEDGGGVGSIGWG
jgi:regulator of nucleoside diphosphate kinase